MKTGLNELGSIRNAKRGQISAIDALIAFTIFSITFSLYLGFEKQAQNPAGIAYEQVYAQAQLVAYTLADTPGSPSGWNQTDFTQIGLADSPGVIDPAKMSSLSASNYSQVTRALGVSEYNLQIKLVNATNGDLVSGSLLTSPGMTNQNSVVPITVPVVYNDSQCLLEVTLWD